MKKMTGVVFIIRDFLKITYRELQMLLRLHHARRDALAVTGDLGCQRATRTRLEFVEQRAQLAQKDAVSLDGDENDTPLFFAGRTLDCTLLGSGSVATAALSA